MYLVDKQNKILKKQIEVGSKFNGMIEVLNGIKQNDLVVYEGINKIRDGSSVKVMNLSISLKNQYFVLF